jgi:succinyl-diaminopimelate desuccinylase
MTARRPDRERLVALTEDLLRIPSQTGDEGAIADFVVGLCSRIPGHTVVRARNSVLVAPLAPRADRDTVMLVGHTDTVPDHGGNPVRRDGDRLYGCGASDMKGAVAVILDAVERAATQPARHDVVGILYAAEEGPFVGNELPYLREAAPDWFARTRLAVCMEPTDLRIELGCLGTSHAKVTFTGRRAHSARPWQGENAIHKAAGLLARLAALAPKEYRFHGLTFVEVASATMIEFRGARNVIPDECTVNVNYRFAPGKDELQVEADLAAIVAGEGTFELVDFCPAGAVAGANPLLAELRVAAGDPEVAAKQAWTDVGRFSAWGIDAVNFGPGATSQAHQAGEWLSIDALHRSADVVHRWLHS